MIGGNTSGLLQYSITTHNDIGEVISEWKDKYSLSGFLDLMNGSSNYLNYNTKMQESTHIFICDYVKLDVKLENSRMIINNEIYDVKFIDNPMELNEHLEIYLKYASRI